MYISLLMYIILKIIIFKRKKESPHTMIIIDPGVYDFI